MPKAKARKKATAKQTARKVSAAKTATAKVVSEIESVSAPETRNRTVTHVNTEDGFKKMPQADSGSESEERKKPAVFDAEGWTEVKEGCTQKRANGMTCLEEMKHAKENPHRYSAIQNQVISEGKNLCEYCLEQE